MPDNRQSWSTLLDQLEDQAQAAVVQTTPDDGGADSGAGDAFEWQPPSDLGPLPEELRDRAQQLADLQQQAMDKLRSAMRSSRRQSAFVASVPRPGNGVRSAYLDTES